MDEEFSIPETTVAPVQQPSSLRWLLILIIGIAFILVLAGSLVFVFKKEASTNATGSSPQNPKAYSSLGQTIEELRNLSEHAILQQISLADVPEKYKRIPTPKPYTLYPVTELARMRTDHGRGSYSESDEYHFAKLDSAECEKIKDVQSVSQNNDVYTNCITHMAYLLGDYTLCKKITEAGKSDYLLRECARWVATQNGDARACFLIPRPTDLATDTSGLEFLSFSGCVRDTIVSYPEESGCKLLERTLGNNPILADVCYLQLAKNVSQEQFCTKVQTHYFRNQCYAELASKKHDITLCDNIIAPDEGIRGSCLAWASASKTGEQCAALRNESVRNSCYYTSARTGNSSLLCGKITQKVSAMEFASVQQSQADCYISFVLDTSNISHCLPIEDSEVKNRCYQQYGIYPESADDCMSIEDSFSLAKASCLLNYAGRTKDLAVCELIDPSIEDRSRSFNSNVKQFCLQQAR